MVSVEHKGKIMNDFKTFKLNDGGSVPTIAFGTGTSFFNRNDAVVEAVVKGIKVSRIRQFTNNELSNKPNTIGLILTI